MHYAISTTWGPTDVTRAAIPFVFAHTALQAGDTVMIMLFHDAAAIAIEGTHPKMIPFGPPSRFDEVFNHPNAEVVVCTACAELRGITNDKLVKNARFGGMDILHAHASRPDAKVINF